MSVDAVAQQDNFTFSGPILGRKDPRTRTKGVMAKRRLQKRQEAEARNAKYRGNKQSNEELQ